MSKHAFYAAQSMYGTSSKKGLTVMGSPTPAQLILADLEERNTQTVAQNSFLRLYPEETRFGKIFASLHERLNQHFEAINDRADTTHHYWAENSRALLALIKELNETLGSFSEASVDIQLSEGYREALKQCATWLTPSGGSTVPDDFKKIRVIKYEPVFTHPETATQLKKSRIPAQLKMMGEGSYAKVYSFIDPDYDMRIALKRAKKGLGERDLYRFRQEFDILKRLDFPYIVKPYRYNEERHEYTMEFCETTLREYIKRRNSSLKFDARKRIVLQFLYGINYIHSEELLHRDISLQNVLLKTYSRGAVLVKLSDFGLAKDQSSEYTRTRTEMRGTIRDPLLISFKEYNILNEIYAIGWIISYVFTGREALTSREDAVSRIVKKCTAHDTGERYQNVLDLIDEIERLNSSDAPG